MERRYSLLLTGVWVGLAFQAKMIEAWLVIPALAITYLVASSTACGPGSSGWLGWSWWRLQSP